MPNNRLRHTLGLFSRRRPTIGLGLQHLQSQKPAKELEAQVRGVEVFLAGSNVVQDTGEEVGLVGEGPVGEGESVLLDCEAEVVDAETVVVGWLGEVGTGVGVDALGKCRGGDGSVGDGDGVWLGVETWICWCICEEGCGRGRDSGEAVLDYWVCHGDR